MSESAAASPPVLFEELDTGSGLRIGVATLSAEKSLNTLTLPTIRLLAERLAVWREDQRIACVVMRGAGERAFCAGADVRSMRNEILAHRGQPAPDPHAQAFFGEEYRLDLAIHRFPKPVLVWASGIVMGGGVGLLVGASHRVVTETSRIAMPEISIGLFADVGGSWFLQRMPHRAGLFLALTGASINAADARYVGLADWFLRSGDYGVLIQHLRQLPWTSTAAVNHATLSNELRALTQPAAAQLPVSLIRTRAEKIAELTLADSLTQLVKQITGYAGEDDWLRKAAATLAHGSPTTAALTWELWHRAKHLGLAEVFRLELIVALQCCAHPDFVEGVRALLVDKDNKPRWTPSTIDEVTPAWIDEHFEAPWPAWAIE